MAAQPPKTTPVRKPARKRAAVPAGPGTAT